MYNKCEKLNFRRSGSYIASSDWIKKATIDQKNKDDKCFSYTVTATLNYREIESHPQRVSNIKPFINKYKWKGINNLSKIDD